MGGRWWKVGAAAVGQQYESPRHLLSTPSYLGLRGTRLSIADIAGPTQQKKRVAWRQFVGAAPGAVEWSFGRQPVRWENLVQTYRLAAPACPS